MALDNLTEDQKKRLDKLHVKYMKKVGIAILLYTVWLFMVNFAVTIFNMAYLHDGQLSVFLYLGNTILYMLGLNGTMQEFKGELEEDVHVVLGDE